MTASKSRSWWGVFVSLLASIALAIAMIAVPAPKAEAQSVTFGGAREPIGFPAYPTNTLSSLFPIMSNSGGVGFTLKKGANAQTQVGFGGFCLEPHKNNPEGTEAERQANWSLDSTFLADVSLENQQALSWIVNTFTSDNPSDLRKQANALADEALKAGKLPARDYEGDKYDFSGNDGLAFIYLALLELSGYPDIRSQTSGVLGSDNADSRDFYTRVGKDLAAYIRAEKAKSVPVNYSVLYLNDNYQRVIVPNGGGLNPPPTTVVPSSSPVSSPTSSDVPPQPPVTSVTVTPTVTVTAPTVTTTVPGDTTTVTETQPGKTTTETQPDVTETQPGKTTTETQPDVTETQPGKTT
ncbi:hypothetical protein GC584_07760, partial [Corynebacterium sp. zg912]|nr:hypothetical protein [Corynebacterium sp. zg912]